MGNIVKVLVTLYYFLIKVLRADELHSRTKGSLIQHNLIIVFHCHASYFLFFSLCLCEIIHIHCPLVTWHTDSSFPFVTEPTYYLYLWPYFISRTYFSTFVIILQTTVEMLIHVVNWGYNTMRQQQWQMWV